MYLRGGTGHIGDGGCEKVKLTQRGKRGGAHVVKLVGPLAHRGTQRGALTHEQCQSTHATGSLSQRGQCRRHLGAKRARVPQPTRRVERRLSTTQPNKPHIHAHINICIFISITLYK